MQNFEEDFIFDSRAVPERTTYLTEGEYDGVVVIAEIKTISTGKLVQVKVDVNGRLVKLGMWIDHKNHNAVLMGGQNLRDCFISVFGADKKARISELVNKPCRVLLEKKLNSQDGRQYIEIARFLPRKGGTQAPAQRQAPTAKPSEDIDVPF